MPGISRIFGKSVQLIAQSLRLTEGLGSVSNAGTRREELMKSGRIDDSA
jgi:hypothetical protein